MSIQSSIASSLAADYGRHGVTQLPGLLSATEIAEIRDVFMHQIESDRGVGHDDRVGDDDPLSRYPRFVHPHRRTELEMGRLARRWMLDPRIVGPVEEMVGPVHAAQSMFYFKPPGARGQALHQDNIFLQAHPETCIAAWVAIDDCDAENGGLKVVPGSHRYEIICPDEADPEESFTSTEITLPEGFAAEQTELASGDVLFFHGSMVHGSGPNRSADRFRRSLIFHYVPVSSVEISRFYNPLLRLDGTEVTIAETADGGACGDGWTPAAPH
ncbi:phytanoyl-CoA dioxygenase family protein [Microbacterium sp. SD291]|uniref:phytanoyl-CoA dioxygenase family protein n=1 Tax=Microbacterium sp. SD291 TaxID=2782007 RepID=UPI001A979C27|nr:phytanoyl-CoA dioxygenase family protein [Microbacterium sp. SD291]MBO0980789.1 phytanoyl-CoA dioxygenase family protein [Microbacterium sp. SD291]